MSATGDDGLTVPGTDDGAAPARRHLAGPSLDEWRPRFRPVHPKPQGAYPDVAVVTDDQVAIYPAAAERHQVGLARLGNRLPARPTGHRCDDGRWYRVPGHGYVCSGDGLHVEKRPLDGPVLDRADRKRLPRINRPDPFRYGKAKDGGPPRFDRLPTRHELEALDTGDAPPAGLVQTWMKGAYWLALARKVKVGGVPLYETVAGRFVRVDDLKTRPTPPMHGVHLGHGRGLPMAFAFHPTQLFCPRDGDLVLCGTVDKHARFKPEGVKTVDGEDYVVTGLGDIPRGDVRIARRISRPKGVGAGERWIHIDLSEQTLTAYQGDTPVFVTLVSTGRPGHDTVRGLFRVQRKYVTKTMRGADADGPYDVQEVPWTMYFHGNYAVHGAYWHDIFGHTKSHGCVNVPPADARWLYYWSSPHLPKGWSAMLGVKGTHVYVDGHTPPGQPPDADDAPPTSKDHGEVAGG